MLITPLITLGFNVNNMPYIGSYFVTVSGFDQLVVCPTHARVGTHNLLLTDVPDLIRVVLVAPIANLDQSSLLAVISMAQAVENLGVGRKLFLRQQVNWNTVCGTIRDLPCRNNLSTDHSVEVFARAFPVGWTLCTNETTRISLGLMTNVGVFWASSRRLIFGGQGIALGLTGESLSAAR